MLRPFPGFVMIKPEPKKKEEDGILLAENDEIKTYYAEVIAIGDERKEEPIICKVGDRIVYNKWASNEIKHGKETYQFLRANEILAVVED